MPKVAVTSGTVRAVRMSQDGKTADLTIHHGATKQPTKGNPFPEQAQTQHTIAAKHAQHFPVGKEVKLTLSTAEPDADDAETSDSPRNGSPAISRGYTIGATSGKS